MAYVVVLEGRHKAGKSTLAQQIEDIARESDEWASVENIHHTRGDSTPEKLEQDKRMIADAPSDKLFIFDRHYLSELVYAPIDGRTSTIPYDPLHWEQRVGLWIDQRGVRLYLMGEPLHNDECAITQMYERLTTRTGWVRVEPREYNGYELARDVLLAIANKRLRNETLGYPADPPVTAEVTDRRDDNYLRQIEAVAGIERGLYALRKVEGIPDNLHAIAHIHYQELQRVRTDLDRTLLKPFEREGELDLWTLQ